MILSIIMLMYCHNFQPVIPGYPVRYMHGITMSHACGIFYRSVMVNCQRAIDNFIFSIIINIIYTKSMITLCFIFTACIIGIKCPVFCNFITYAITVSIFQIVCCQTCSGVVSSCKYCKRRLSIKVCCCRQESVYTVAVCIPPGTNFTSCRCVIYRVNDASIFTIEHCEIFRSIQNVSTAVTIIILITDYINRQF